MQRRLVKKVGEDPISESPPGPEKSYEEAERDLITYVEKHINLMNNNLLFGGMEEPSFYALNRSLMDYENVALGLIALHQEVRYQKDVTNERYDNFYAEKYCEIKMSQVTLGKSAQFTAAREIEMFVRKTYMNELAVLKAECIKAENKYNFINYLISSWEKYSFILNQLSANARAEAGASRVASQNPKEFDDD